MSNAFDKASLVMLPHAYEDGKVYSLKPTDRSGDFTFSRGSDTATRVGEDGYIKKEISNLLLQSNSFTTSPWGYNQATISVTGSQAGYDGSNNAWLLESLNTSTSEISQSVSFNGVYNYSVYAKAGTANYLVLLEALGQRVYFDLSNGAIGAKVGTIDASIESVGNGWYRCSFSFLRTSTTTARIYVADADNSLNSALGSNILIQDAQINQGLVAQDYLETTTAPVYGGLTDNMPRLDYTDATCPSLLLEPSRTNTVAHSEYFNSSQYNKLNTTAIDNNAIISPEGMQNASKVRASVTSTTALGFENTSITSQYKAFSIFAKAGEISEMLVFGIQVSQGVFFNLNDGSISGYYQGNSSEIDNAYSVDYGNGWYRYIIIWASNSRPRIFTSDNQQITFSQTAGNGFYAYGLQYEDASYPTSYIPTYGSSQTRAEDNSTTGDISSIVNSTEGTIFTESAKIKDFSLFLLSDGTQNNKITLYPRNNTTQLTFIFTVGGVQQIRQDPSPSGLDTTQFNKYAIAWGLNDFRVYVNGVNIYTSTSNITLGSGALNDLDIDTANHKQFLIFQEALSDSELQALTTL